MKYCLFESGDVVGPLTAEEISLRPGFGPHTFVCPEEHSEDETYWKEACAYADFEFAQEPSAVFEAAPEEKPVPDASAPDKPLLSESRADSSANDAESSAVFPATKDELSKPEPPRPISAILLDASEETRGAAQEQQPADERKEMLSSLDQAAPLALQPDKNPEMPAVDFQTVSSGKVSPIEEYFNTIRSGDLGNILGIPDAKENSDMSLSRAMRNQFEKTEPPSVPVSDEQEEDPFDAFPAPASPSETFLESASGVSLSQPSEKPDVSASAAEAAVPEASAAPTGSLPRQNAPEAKEAQKDSSTEPFSVPAEEKPNPKPAAASSPKNFPAHPETKEPETPDAVTTILDGKLEVKQSEPDIVEPIKAVEPAEQTRKKTAGEEAFPVAPVFVAPEQKRGKVRFLFFVLGVLLLAAGLWLHVSVSGEPSVPAEPVSSSLTSSVSASSPTPEAVRSVSVPAVSPVPQSPAEPTDPLELSKLVAQRHELGKGRGTVEEYLNKRYASELAAGYSSVWSSEPLHRNVYVVKYRLAKARKEPIVYIFQADVAKKKLTGALNNITLDLVGKIRD